MKSKAFANDPLEFVAIDSPRTVPFRDCESQAGVVAVLVYPHANQETRALKTAVSSKYPLELFALAEPAVTRKVFRDSNCEVSIYQE